MSQQSVEIVRETFQRFEARDIDGLTALYAPDAITFAPEGWPESGPFVGRDAVIGQFARLFEDWADQHVALIDSTEGGDWVVVRFEWRVRGSGSGVETRAEMSAAYRFAGGRIAEVRFHWSHERALEDAGLSE
jgi:ketosteroid isomerase-like protein